MNKDYQEKIICGKCKNEHYRDIESLEASGKHCELDKPLNVVIVKKFKCKNCKETHNYKIEIVKTNSKKNAI